jgi:hypothetical protein
VSGEIDKITEMNAKLEGVSPSFCLAKWLQVTIHLQNGFTHSCHHPVPHKIPASELKNNPSALHNTLFKKRQREMMLSGERPPECDYCWKLEDTGAGSISDRHIKSHEPWAAPHFDRIRGLPSGGNINPTYVEVSFSNTCNFKCAYCSPPVSSKWMEEVRQHGAYPTSQRFNNLEWIESSGRTPLLESERNPYLDAFWEWWPELYHTLEVFRITGGEPLLTRHTFRILEYIMNHPRPELDLAVNSNLGVPRPLIEKFADQVQAITESGSVKNFTIYTSIDTWGAQAEYIRTGMHTESFWRNVRYLLGRLGKIQIVFMCTFNALSVPGFRPLLEELLKLKEEFHSQDRSQIAPAILDISYLRYPDHLSVQILPKQWCETLQGHLEFMESFAEERNRPYHGFYDFERAKMRRLLEWMRTESPDSSWLNNARTDFFLHFREHDRRRGTDFLTTFPEFREFWERCASLADGVPRPEPAR